MPIIMELWQIIFWAVVAVLLIAAELFTLQFISVWFAAGGLTSFVLSFFNTDFYMQVILFLAISAILLFIMRPLLRRFIKPNKALEAEGSELPLIESESEQ